MRRVSMRQFWVGLTVEREIVASRPASGAKLLIVVGACAALATVAACGSNGTPSEPTGAGGGAGGPSSSSSSSGASSSTSTSSSSSGSAMACATTCSAGGIEDEPGCDDCLLNACPGAYAACMNDPSSGTDCVNCSQLLAMATSATYCPGTMPLVQALLNCGCQPTTCN